MLFDIAAIEVGEQHRSHVSAFSMASRLIIFRVGEERLIVFRVVGKFSIWR